MKNQNFKYSNCKDRKKIVRFKKNRNKRKSGNYLYGKNSILERLKANPASIKQIYLDNKFKSEYIIRKIKEANIPCKYISENELSKIKRADRLQGIVADIELFKYADFEDLVSSPDERKALKFVFLDGINDPHNLGAILRVLACFGNFAVVIPKHNSCEVNDTAMHVSSGAENYVPVCSVNNLANAAIYLKSFDYKIYGAIVEDGEVITSVAFPEKTCIILGSEGKGIRKGLRQYLDTHIKIPMNGVALSFNVAIATSLFVYEISKQNNNSSN